MRKNRGIDETSAQCLFCPREFAACSDGISQTSIDHRLFRCFAAKEDCEGLAVFGQIPSLDNCGQERSKRHGQIACTAVDTYEKSTNDQRSYTLSEITDVVARRPVDIYFETATEFLKDETLLDQMSEACDRCDLDAKVENDFVANENIGDKSDLQLVSVSHSHAFIPTLSASSNRAESTDNVNFDNMVEKLSISQRNSHVGEGIERERGNDVAYNLYKSAESNLVCKETETDPKSWDYLDEIRSLTATEVSDCCSIMRRRHTSENSATSNSSGSSDLELTEYDIIRRNRCLSLTLPARMSSRNSNHEQGGSYPNVRRTVKSLPVDSSWHRTAFVNASNGVFANLSNILSHQDKAQISTKPCHQSHAPEKNGVENNELRKCEECDFDSRRPDAEISSFQRAERIHYDLEPAFHRVSSPDLACVHVTLREEQASFEEDNSKKPSLSDDVSCRDSDISSVSDTVSDCSEFKDYQSNEADTKQILVSRIHLHCRIFVLLTYFLPSLLT